VLVLGDIFHSEPRPILENFSAGFWNVFWQLVGGLRRGLARRKALTHTGQRNDSDTHEMY
jgi:hypothetical protein